MLVLVFLVLAGVRAVAGEIGFWVELVIVIGVVFAYRPVVVRLGIAPSEWE
jgi:cytosine/uracil/thiamine/allantoin permease